MIDHLDQHTAFEPLPEIDEHMDWRTSDPASMRSTPPFVLQPKTLDEMTVEELHESVVRQVHDLEAAVDRSRAARGDERC